MEEALLAIGKAGRRKNGRGNCLWSPISAVYTCCPIFHLPFNFVSGESVWLLLLFTFRNGTTFMQLKLFKFKVSDFYVPGKATPP